MKLDKEIKVVINNYWIVIIMLIGTLPRNVMDLLYILPFIMVAALFTSSKLVKRWVIGYLYVMKKRPRRFRKWLWSAFGVILLVVVSTPLLGFLTNTALTPSWVEKAGMGFVVLIVGHLLFLGLEAHRFEKFHRDRCVRLGE